MQSFDITIAGGGIFGLSVAYALKGTGAKVLLLEKRFCGAGASGGILGALMPHVPDQWNMKKAFQFEALSHLPRYLNELEAKTGVSTGYRRLGRIMPVRSDNDVVYAMSRAAESQTHWRTIETGFSFTYKSDEAFTHWLAPEAAPLGYIHDTLAARINPRRYIAALKAAVVSHCRIIEGEALESYEAGVAKTASGNSFRSGKVVIAAGHESFSFLAPLMRVKPGSGIKGQSALLRFKASLQGPQPPVIYDDGIYIVPHGEEFCAVGSTSEREWHDASATDEALEGMIARARELCRPLRDTEVAERWAGVRPRARRRDPMLGAVPGAEGLFVATGGFKISFGIAHLVGQAVADMLMEKMLTVPLPESFTVEHHLK